ncbi:MAG: GNAT family N-acetyltransferase [Clostridia bacterium]
MNNGTFEIRRAAENDAEAIHEITRDAFRKYCEMAGISDIEALHESLEDVKRDIAEKTVLVAYMDGTVVGSLRLTMDEQTKTAYLGRFGVSGLYRNNGIGKALVGVADMTARRHGMEKTRLHTASKVAELMRFYYSRGFYAESVSSERGYLRAEMVKELV